MKIINPRLDFPMTYFPIEVHQKIKFRVFLKGVFFGIALLLFLVGFRTCRQNHKTMKASHKVQTGQGIAEVNALMGVPDEIYTDENSLLVFYYATPNLIFISSPKVYFNRDFRVVKVDMADD